MTRYRYKALDASGRSHRGEVEASSKEEAADAVLVRRLTPISIRPLSDQTAGALSYREAGRLGRDLARMCSSGVPLETGARLAAEAQESNSARQVLVRAADRLAKGAGAAAAFGDLPGVPGRALAAAIQAGDRSGRLPEALSAAAPLMTAMAQFREKLVSLLLYPLIVCVTAVGVLVIFLMVVVPSLRPLLMELGEGMPFSTRMLLWFADAAPGVIGGLLVGVLVLILARQIPSVRQAFGRWRDRMLLTPLGFGLSQAVDGAVFASLFAALIKSGLAADEAIEGAAPAVSNTILKERILLAARRVREGEDVSEALGGALGYGHLVVQASRLGVRGGEYGELVQEAGAVLVERAELRLERLASVSGPLIIIALGVLIAMFVVSLFSSLMALTDAATL